jgi:hypothetical protein
VCVFRKATMAKSAATAWDYIRALVIFSIFAAVVVAVAVIAKKISTSITDFKQKYNVDDSGIKIKTNRRFDTEKERDSVQAGIMKAWKNSSFKYGSFPVGVCASMAHQSPSQGARYHGGIVADGESTRQGQGGSRGQAKVRNPFLFPSQGSDS